MRLALLLLLPTLLSVFLLTGCGGKGGGY